MGTVQMHVLLAALLTTSASAADYIQGYYSDSQWSSDDANQWMGSRLRAKCIDIPSNLTLCRGMEYPQMRLPNLLEHDTIAEVTQQAKPWVSLSNIHCHPNTKLFLCSLFSPVCLPDRVIWPCKSLCEAVKKGCEVRMNKYGYDWPEMLRCDKFPADNDLCIGPPPTEPPKPADKACQPCREPDTFEGIVDNYCRADFVGRMVLQSNETDGRDTKVVVSKKRYLKKGTSLSKRDLRAKEFYLENGTSCQCKPLRRRKRGRAKYLMMGVKQNNRMVITLLQKYGKDQRRALRKIKRTPNLCREGPKALGDDSSVVPEGNKASKPDRKTDRKTDRKSDRKSERKASSKRRRDRTSKRRKARNGRKSPS